MSIANILVPNNYEIYGNFNGPITSTDIVYNTIRQNNNLGPAVDSAGDMTSDGSIDINGQISAVTGITTPASVQAGIQVEAPLINATDQITCQNNITSVSGDIIATNGNISADQNITAGNNITSLGTITAVVSVSGQFVAATDSALIGDSIAHTGTFISLTPANSFYRQTVSYTTSVTLSGVDLTKIIINTNTGGTPVFTLPTASSIAIAYNIGNVTALTMGQSFSFPLVCNASSTSVTLANSVDGTSIVHQPIVVNSGTTRTVYGYVASAGPNDAGAIVFY